MSEKYTSTYTGEQIDSGINKANTAVQPEALETVLGNKQDTLVSGENIKTINNQSILGEGNITIQGEGDGNSSDKYICGVSAVCRDVDYARGSIEDIYRINTDIPSWSDVEDAINNGEDIEISLDLMEPDMYLNKSATLDFNETSLRDQNSVHIEETGSLLSVSAHDLYAGSKDGDYFSLVIRVDQNNASIDTQNRLVIYVEDTSIDNLYISSCYIVEDKDNRSLDISSYGNVFYTSIFKVNSEDNMPEIHITFNANKDISDLSLEIGFERYHNYDTFEYDYTTINDSYHTDVINYRIHPQVINTSYSPHPMLIGTLFDGFNEICLFFDRESDTGICVDIRNTITHREYQYIVDKLDNLDTVVISVEDGYINSHTTDYILDALYERDNDNKELFHLREEGRTLSVSLRINNSDIRAVVPACLDIPPRLQLPYSTKYTRELDNALGSIKIHGQYGTKMCTVKQTKSLYFNPYPDDSYDTEDIDISGMLRVTATYDQDTEEWTLNKSFSEIFTDEVKESGILLTVENMYSRDSDRGYDYEYDSEDDEWNQVATSYTQSLVFTDDHFIGTYYYSGYHEGFGAFGWSSTISIEVRKDYTFETKDIAAVPTVSIIAGLTTNINGFALQTFAATELQTDGTYSWYEIRRNNETCSYEDTADYMEYMTGSRFVPVYNFQKPLNTVLITSQFQFLKPQYDNSGLKLYVLPLNLSSIMQQQ